jgi:hypothetical protein
MIGWNTMATAAFLPMMTCEPGRRNAAFIEV